MKKALSIMLVISMILGMFALPAFAEGETAGDTPVLERPTYNYYTNPINENINVTLYNYGSYINVGDDKTLQFGWHNNLAAGGRPYEGIDGPAMQTSGEVFTTYAQIYYSNKLYNFPTVDRLLNDAGYPQIAAYQKIGMNRNSGEIVNASLEYLFPKTGDALKVGAATDPLTNYNNMRAEANFIENNGFNSNYESMRFEMVGDGGLFEKREDGYYYYNSAERSAYYDVEQGRFLLSETLIGPSHEGTDIIQTYPNYGRNFLPFNKINFANTDQFYQMGDQWVYMTQYAVNSDAARNDIADLWFGFDMDFDFFIPKNGQVNGEDMIFSFKGDDDIWVYIDDVLILDIAGCHGPVSSWINFATGVVYNCNVGYSTGDSRDQYTTIKAQFEGALGADYVAENMADMFDENGAFVDYSGHTLKFFYTERGGNISYCGLKFNMPAMPSGSLSVGKEIDIVGNSAPEFITDALSYEFRVADAENTSKSFIPVGTPFAIVDSQDYDIVLGRGVVGSDGYFTLKAGEVALFEDVYLYGDAYIVEERIPGESASIYGEVEYVAGNKGVTNTVTTDDAASSSYLTYYTPELSALKTQKVTFTNKVNVSALTDLTITKVVTGSKDAEKQETYQINLLLGDDSDNLAPVSVGTTYRVGSEERVVAEEGIIELAAGETATLRLITGTCYEVEEIVLPDYNYSVSYENEIGTVEVDGDNDVTVTNKYLSSIAEETISGIKYFNNHPAAGFSFVLEHNGKIIDTAESGRDGEFSFSTLKFVEEGEYVYKVYETDLTNSAVIYDESVYEVTVTVTRRVNFLESQVTVTKNGDDHRGGIKFYNESVPPITVFISGAKELIGGELEGGEFEFILEDTYSGATWSTTNDESGNFCFDIELDEDGYYQFVVSEANGGREDIIYDSTEYNVNVTIRRDEDGHYTASIGYKGFQNIVFVNEVVAEETTAAEETTEAPEETVEPEETTEAPEDTTEVPEETTEAPEDTTEAPEETTEAPEETTEAPEETTEAPEETTEAPEDSTEAPEDSTEAPEDTTEVSEETTEAPEVTTEPEETTEEEIVLPDDSTPLDPAPDTGDNALIIILAAIASLALGVVYIKRRHSEE